MSAMSRIAGAWRALTSAQKVAKRSAFLGADSSRFTAAWATSPTHMNRALYQDLRVLRARSRELARNNEFASKFLTMVADNIVGHNGFGLQVHALQNGKIDQLDSDACENAFAAWSARGVCDVTGTLSFVDFQRLFIRTVAMDGESLVRLHLTGPFGFQVELVDVTLLDERVNMDLPNGNKVRMSVEYDRMHKPVAYHLMKSDYADPQNFGIFGGGSDYERVPADQIWHCFVRDAVAQLRGAPWITPALYRLQMLAGYEEAAMVAARLGAAQSGFFESPDGELSALADSTEDGTAEGPLQMDVEPGTFRGLPPGYKFSSFDPKYPHEMYADFVKVCLRGVSAGIDVSYNGLANDLEGVNYSSIRAGVQDERESWKGMQGWMVRSFLAPLYSAWLPQAILTGNLRVPFSKLAKFDAAVWQGRRWDWVDPAKDISASVEAIQNGLKSYSQLIREQGRDPEEVWLELERDRKRLLALGLNLDGKAAPPMAVEKVNAE